MRQLWLPVALLVVLTFFASLSSAEESQRRTLLSTAPRIKHFKPVRKFSMHFPSAGKAPIPDGQDFHSELVLYFEAQDQEHSYTLTADRRLITDDSVVTIYGENNEIEKQFVPKSRSYWAEHDGIIVGAVVTGENEIHAIIRNGDEVFVLAPKRLHVDDPRVAALVDSHMVMYRLADVDHSGHRCGQGSHHSEAEGNEGAADEESSHKDSSTKEMRQEGADDKAAAVGTAAEDEESRRKDPVTKKMRRQLHLTKGIRNPDSKTSGSDDGSSRRGRRSDVPARWSNCYAQETKTASVTVAFAVDSTYYAAIGGTDAAVTTAIQQTLTSANVIYYYQLNVILTQGVVDVRKAVTNSPSWASCSGSAGSDRTGNGMGALLNKLSATTQNSRQGAGLWHLLTACYAPPGVVGIAWIRGLCDPYLGNGVTTYTGSSTWLTTAHEIGHNFGANHVFYSDSMGGLMDYGSGVYRSTGLIQFADENKAEVCAEMNRKWSRCFVYPTTTPVPDPTRAPTPAETTSSAAKPTAAPSAAPSGPTPTSAPTAAPNPNPNGNVYAVSPSATMIVAGGNVSCAWTASLGSRWADYVALYPIGSNTFLRGQAVYLPVGKVSGWQRFDLPASTTPGDYVCQIRQDSWQNPVLAVSSTFKITSAASKSLQVTSPTGSSRWTNGAIVWIRWSSTGLAQSATIRVSIIRRTWFYTSTVERWDNLANTGELSISVPKSLYTGTYYVQVESGSVIAKTADFSVFTAVGYQGALGPNYYLPVNSYLVSPGQTAYLLLQADGNVVLYKGSGPGDTQGALWSTSTASSNAPSSFYLFNANGWTFDTVVKAGTRPTRYMSLDPVIWSAGTTDGKIKNLNVRDAGTIDLTDAATGATLWTAGTTGIAKIGGDELVPPTWSSSSSGQRSRSSDTTTAVTKLPEPPKAW